MKKRHYDMDAIFDIIGMIIALGKEKKDIENYQNMEGSTMRKEYDFSSAEPNPYIKKLRKQISIRIDVDTIQFFKKQAEETGITYQNLINLYLSDCAVHSKKIDITWK